MFDCATLTSRTAYLRMPMQRVCRTDLNAARRGGRVF